MRGFITKITKNKTTMELEKNIKNKKEKASSIGAVGGSFSSETELKIIGFLNPYRQYLEYKIDCEKSKLTKLFLNKIINWSSSRYNTWKKKEVVEHIYKSMNEGGWYQKSYGEGKIIETLEVKDYFHSGSYCESGSCSRHGTYFVDYEQKAIISVIDNDSREFREILGAWCF